MEAITKHLYFLRHQLECKYYYVIDEIKLIELELNYGMKYINISVDEYIERRCRLLHIKNWLLKNKKI